MRSARTPEFAREPAGGRHVNGPDRRFVGHLSEQRVDDERAAIVAEMSAVLGCPPAEIEVEIEHGPQETRLRGFWIPEGLLHA